MDLSTLANVATAFAVLTAVAFGLLETRRARKECAKRAAFATVQAILTPEWMNSMIVVQSLRTDRLRRKSNAILDFSRLCRRWAASLRW